MVAAPVAVALSAPSSLSGMVGATSRKQSRRASRAVVEEFSALGKALFFVNLFGVCSIKFSSIKTSFGVCSISEAARESDKKLTSPTFLPTCEGERRLRAKMLGMGSSKGWEVGVGRCMGSVGGKSHMIAALPIRPHPNALPLTYTHNQAGTALTNKASRNGRLKSRIHVCPRFNHCKKDLKEPSHQPALKHC